MNLKMILIGAITFAVGMVIYNLGVKKLLKIDQYEY